MGRAAQTTVRLLRWVFSPYHESRSRRHMLVGSLGGLLAAFGLLAYALLLPELPFASAPTTRIGDAAPGDAVKVYGRINCSCLIAINLTEEQVGLGLSETNWSIEPFTVQDPTGTVSVDVDSLAILKRGAHGGDYWRDDLAAVYGHIYDQGGGVLAIRAQAIAPTVDDSPARFSWAFAAAAAVGGLLIVAVLADRWIFGHAPE